MTECTEQSGKGLKSTRHNYNLYTGPEAEFRDDENVQGRSRDSDGFGGMMALMAGNNNDAIRDVAVKARVARKLSATPQQHLEAAAK